MTVVYRHGKVTEKRDWENCSLSDPYLLHAYFSYRVSSMCASPKCLSIITALELTCTKHPELCEYRYITSHHDPTPAVANYLYKYSVDDPTPMPDLYPLPGQGLFPTIHGRGK